MIGFLKVDKDLGKSVIVCMNVIMALDEILWSNIKVFYYFLMKLMNVK